MQSKQGNEPLVSNENDIEGFTPEILNSSIEKEKLPNDKPLSVNENTPTSKKELIETYPGIILYLLSLI